VGHLLFQVIVRAVEPIPALCAAMNAKRSTNGVSKFSRSQFVVLWEDFNSLRQTSASDSYSEFQRQAVDINSALPRQGGFLHEDPQMATPLAHLQGGLHTVLLEGVLQLEQVFHRPAIIGINRDPLRALCRGVNRVQPDGEFAFQVTPDCGRGEAQLLAFPLCLRSKVIMAPALWTGSEGLKRIGSAVYEKTTVVHQDMGARLNCGLHGSSFPSSSWRAKLALYLNRYPIFVK